MLNPNLIRNRLKISAAVTNAQLFIQIQKEYGSFAKYSWNFVGDKPIISGWKKHEDIPVATEQSIAFSKDLKKRGFKFVGPTIIYAHMQACGMVNDHITECFRYSQLNGA